MLMFFAIGGFIFSLLTCLIGLVIIGKLTLLVIEPISSMQESLSFIEENVRDGIPLDDTEVAVVFTQTDFGVGVRIELPTHLLEADEIERCHLDSYNAAEEVVKKLTNRDYPV